MENLTQNGGLAALVIALTGLAGKYIDKKFLPLVSLFLGIGISLIVSGLTVDAGIIGLVIGLSASGLYDHKKILNG